jgi:hypothetical protein
MSLRITVNHYTRHCRAYIVGSSRLHLQSMFRSHLQPVTGVVYDAESRQLVTGSTDGCLHTWQVPDCLQHAFGSVAPPLVQSPLELDWPQPVAASLQPLLPDTKDIGKPGLFGRFAAFKSRITSPSKLARHASVAHGGQASALPGNHGRSPSAIGGIKALSREDDCNTASAPLPSSFEPILTNSPCKRIGDARSVPLQSGCLTQSRPAVAASLDFAAGRSQSLRQHDDSLLPLPRSRSRLGPGLWESMDRQLSDLQQVISSWLGALTSSVTLTPDCKLR